MMGDAIGRPPLGILRLLLLIAACTAAFAALGTGVAQASKDPTVWLCKPGVKGDPCLTSRKATVVTYAGETRNEAKERPTRTSPPPVDCFYVYPTVSEQEGPNANEVIEPSETQIAIDQASRFSQDCRVYAPMYPQLTLAAINNPEGVSPLDEEKAYLGVKDAWQQYMARYNKGRGVILIGHSQGSLMLEQLIREQIEPNSAELSHLVSAVILGGNVLVPEGQLEGGTFAKVPACQQANETGCVIAYSSFAEEPPEGAFFGRTNSPLLGGGPPIPGVEVMCVNPTLLTQDGSTGSLLPYASTTPFPGELGLAAPAPEASTPWVAEPGVATAQCKHENGASWLQVTLVGTSPSVLDERIAKHEIPLETLGPDWGLHLYDVNEALGNLVKTVAIQSDIYTFGS